jgi:plastocyanin
MRRGTYNIQVRDRSRLHNAHIVAPGYNRRTTVNFVGTQRWRVRLARVGTFRFLCDVHPSTMRGTIRVVG